MHLSAQQLAGLVMVGLIVGILSSILGIGGGVLVIPLLLALFSFTHQQAVGTSIGMLLPPIGIFAFLVYHRAGQVNLAAAGMLALGFAIGGYFGAILVTTGKIPEHAMRNIFAFFLLYIAGTILFRDDARVRAVIATLLLLAAFTIVRFFFAAVGGRWERRFSIDQTYRHQLQHPVEPDYEI